MTEPSPQGKRSRRKHLREGPNSWQNQDTARPRQNPGPKSDDPLTQARLEREHYDPANHPHNASGENICGAWKVREKMHCARPAGQLTDHEGWGRCSFHGGNTPTLRSSAAKWVGGEVIHRMTKSYGYGGPVDLTPIDALLGEVQRCGGHVAWLGERLSMWELFPESSTGKPKVMTPAQRELLDLYHEERKMLIKAAKTALDAGVNERKVRLAEMQGAMMIKAINTVLDGLNLTTEQRRQIPIVVPAALRGLTDSAPEQPLMIENPKQVDRT